VPFAVSKVHAACGIMITASHNGKEYNGYKVYWENAVQIISPHDKGISKAIQENLNPVSWSTTLQSSFIEDHTQKLREEYVNQLQWFAEYFGHIALSLRR